VAKLKETISVSKRARQNFDLERFYLRKVDDVEVKGKYQVEFPNRYGALETQTRVWTLIMLWKVLEKISRNQRKKI
jgi:hypothetical protein